MCIPCPAFQIQITFCPHCYRETCKHSAMHSKVFFKEYSIKDISLPIVEPTALDKAGHEPAPVHIWV